MILLAHPTGNANVRQAAQALSEAGLLTEFWTCVNWRADAMLNRVLPNSLRTLLNRRTFPNIPQKEMRCYPWHEIARLAAGRYGLSSLVRHEVGKASVDAVYRSLDKRVASELVRRSDIFAVHAYEDGALDSFRIAQPLGVRTIYELPIGYWKAYRELMEEEAELQPEWAKTLPGNVDSVEKRARKDEELALASRILVPSQYVRQTLEKAEYVRAPISVIPYGAPAPQATGLRSVRKAGEKLRVIFVGSLGQRKGLSYLLKAIEMLGSSIELTLIGRQVGESKPLEAACRKHRWIASLAHAEVLREIRNHDVMVFPSLFEGFGLVILEAMACGVPVIATPNGAAPDILTDGEDGFVVPIRDAEAIAEKLRVLDCDRARLEAMSDTALRTAAVHSWEEYRARLVKMSCRTLAEPGYAPVLSPGSPIIQPCNS